MDSRKEFAGAGRWRFALREMPELGRWPVQIAVLLLLGAAFAWIGPYGTYYDLSLGRRFAYWMLSMPLIGMPAGMMLRLLMHGDPARSWPAPAQAIATAVIIGLPGTFVVIALETIFRRPPPITAASLVTFYGSVTLMIALIAVPFAIIHAYRARQAQLSAGAAIAGKDAAAISENGAAAANGSPFLRRLPARLGTGLHCIATEDHYLRVTTDLGSDLILFRLADAVAELDPAMGQQVHRSYWVARRAVAAVERDGHRTWLMLAGGAKIPVSRTYLPALREAGWLGA